MTVYLLYTDDGRYKIGYTRREILERIKELKTGNSNNFTVINTYKSKFGTKIEAALHQKFKEKKIEGEWFLLESEDVDNFIENCEKIENMFKVLENNTWIVDRRK